MMALMNEIDQCARFTPWPALKMALNQSRLLIVTWKRPDIRYRQRRLLPSDWRKELVPDLANLIHLPPHLFSSNAFHQAPFNPKRGGRLRLSSWLDGFVRPIFVNRERLAKTFEMTKFSVPQFASNFFKRFDYIFSI
jgi:hypothetical protein